MSHQRSKSAANSQRNKKPKETNGSRNKPNSTTRSYLNHNNQKIKRSYQLGIILGNPEGILVVWEINQ
jgi:hypothetical protein